MNPKIFVILMMGTILFTTSCGSGGETSSVPGAGSVTVTGTAAYEDRVFDKNGFTGEIQQKPIRNAIVELVTTSGAKVIASGATDAFGKFTLTGSNGANPAGLSLQVLSKTAASSNTKVEIRNNETEKALFAVVSPTINDGDTETLSVQQDVLATVSAGVGGAFNLLDEFSKASEFVQKSGPCPAPNTGCIPPLLLAYWETGSSDGTFYETQKDAIFILGGASDTDEYDDVVILHEYAHFLLSKFSKDDSPGGSHALNKNDQDIRLSWSEGWADFFAAAVRDSPLYVDTGAGGILISLNMEDYSSIPNLGLSAASIYTTNEIAVAGTLWDVIDGSNAGETETLDLNFTEVWQTVLAFPSASPATMERFWIQFSTGVLTSSLNTDFQDILIERKIELFADTSEGVEPSSFVLNAAPQKHTLYGTTTPNDPTGDVDTVTFSATANTTYTVKTLNLSNGADTFLTIKNPSGDVIANGTSDNLNSQTFSSCGISIITQTSNCPKNGSSTLSSSVTFTASTTGTFTAEVSHSPSAPPSAGLLGSYEILITSP